MVYQLRAGSKYKFKVAAENKFGVGLPSTEMQKWIETQTLRMIFIIIYIYNKSN